MRRAITVPVLLTLLLLGLSSPVVAQTRQPPGFDDYGRWETLSQAGSHGGLSPDGRWLVYAIDRNDGDDELRITAVSGGSTEVIPFGAQPAYSSDSRWIAYRVGRSEEETERMREADEPVEDGLGLRNLETGESWTIDGINAFSFSPDGAYLAMARYPAEPSGGSSGNRRGGAREDRPGTTLLVRPLGGGEDMSFGNVSEFEWMDVDGTHLLAMVIGAQDRMGNGVHLFDPSTSEVRVLVSSSSVYRDLAWREGNPDLAVFRSLDEEGKEGPAQEILAWTGLDQGGTFRSYDPTADPAFPRDMRTVPFRGLSWSDNGGILFLGLAGWEDTPAPAEKGQEGPPAREAEDPATVQVWHWTDVFVMPWQERHADQDRERNLLAAWHLGSGRLTPLGQDLVEERVTPIPHTQLAWVAEWSRYAMARSIGRTGADLYLQDMRTGERTPLKENINDRYVQASPGGKYLLFLDQENWWTIDVATREIRNVTASAPVSFIDTESDQTSKVYPDELQKPPFGVAGWTTDDEAVLLYDDYDVWAVDPEGEGATRLTEGAGDEVRHRIVRPDRERRRFFGASAGDEEGIDLDEPLYLSIYGEWTKQSGYAVREPGGRVRRLIWLDKNVGSLVRAEKADVFAYVVQDFDDSPDIFVGGADLREARQVTETNPFQRDFAWGRSQLIDYTTDQGRHLQGALIYPAGYEAGRQYPMIVYNYELLSQNVHRYVVPSDRSYYNLSVFANEGYLVLLPDIVFRPRQPGWSVVECIGAGVEKVIEMGVVDPEAVGIVGHSMGGFNTTFVATHTEGMFAAAVAGAPITDLVSYYGDHHWGTGIAETDHIETGQERMVVALYEDLQAYIDNSAVFGAHDMTVPLLLEAGDQDGIVAWYQSIELYNIARRAGRNVVMVTYAGEDHGLRQPQNQRDYQQRILAWFGHYLKGEPAEPWITEGKSYLEREAELKRLEAGG